MEIKLVINKDDIDVVCEIPVDKEQYTFALANSMVIHSILFENIKIEDYKICECEMFLRPSMNKYTIEGLGNGILTVSYSGTVEGQFAFFDDRLKHFSLYNGWYPMGYDVEEVYDVVLQGEEGFYLVNGTYNEKENTWFYSTREFKIIADCNVLFLNSKYYKSKREDGVNVYWLEKERELPAKRFGAKYGGIRTFYNKLFGNDKVETVSAVFLPDFLDLGAYMRDHLIVFASLSEDEGAFHHHMAHEMGHAYTRGVDYDSWEDWLSETHAEWAALLYLLEYDPERFEQYLGKLTMEYQKQELLLNPNGLDRPENVHDVGVLIYNKIFSTYGKEAIYLLLRTFDQLSEKSTEVFLSTLAKKDSELAEIIRSHIKA